MRISDWSSDVCSSDLDRNLVEAEDDLVHPPASHLAFDLEHLEAGGAALDEDDADPVGADRSRRPTEDHDRVRPVSPGDVALGPGQLEDRKSTRMNSCN